MRHQYPQDPDPSRPRTAIDRAAHHLARRESITRCAKPIRRAALWRGLRLLRYTMPRHVWRPSTRHGHHCNPLFWGLCSCFILYFYIVRDRKQSIEGHTRHHNYHCKLLGPFFVLFSNSAVIWMKKKRKKRGITKPHDPHWKLLGTCFVLFFISASSRIGKNRREGDCKTAQPSL